MDIPVQTVHINAIFSQKPKQEEKWVPTVRDCKNGHFQSITKLPINRNP